MIRIAIGTLAAGVVLVIAPAAATITCQSSPPRGVAASYRTIEGRKCWYAGRHHIDKAQLAWRREAYVLPPKREPDPAGEAVALDVGDRCGLARAGEDKIIAPAGKEGGGDERGGKPEVAHRPEINSAGEEWLGPGSWQS